MRRNLTSKEKVILMSLPSYSRQSVYEIKLNNVSYSIQMYGDIKSTPQWEILKKYLKANSEYKCALSNITNIECYGPLQLHHKIPTALGGTNLPDNLEWLCAEHHSMYHPHLLQKNVDPNKLHNLFVEKNPSWYRPINSTAISNLYNEETKPEEKHVEMKSKIHRNKLIHIVTITILMVMAALLFEQYGENTELKYQIVKMKAAETKKTKTFDEWKELGYKIIKGSKAHWVAGVPMFDESQVTKHHAKQQEIK